jgi:hypothetical protein
LLHLSSSSPKIQLTDTSTGADHILDGDSGVGSFWVKVDDNAEGSNPAFIVNVAGSETLRVDSSGRLGIGNTTPSSFDGEANQLVVGNGTGDQGVTIYTGSSVGDHGSIFFADGTSGGAVKKGQIRYEHNNEVMSFWTNESERCRIDSSGRLLVGTSSSSLSQQIESASTGGNNLGVIRYNNGSGGSEVVLAHSRSNSIGTNTVVSSGDRLGDILFRGGDGTNYIDAASISAQVDGTPGANDMPGRLVFSTTADGASSPTEHLRINEKGTFHFSTSGSYTSAGGIYNEIYQNNNSAVCLYARSTATDPYGYQVYYDQAKNNAGYEFFYASDVSAQRCGIRSNGGIANYQSNNVNLCDEREKKNIVNLDSTWDCLKHWELKKFHYNEDADTDDLRYGVIAQQVANYCPEVISEWVKQKAEPAKLDNAGNEIEPAKEEILRMAVKEQQMMWMAIKALQEAQLRIETLEAKVNVLEGN